MASAWAVLTQQEYHVDSPNKTAVLLLGRAARPDDYNRQPLVLSGKIVPCVLQRKWCGIVWDANLSFLPFLHARMAAARGAFAPILALVREGTAPPAEARDAMRSVVEGSLFYGAMFFIFAEGAGSLLNSLQLEFERKVLGLPPWIPDVVVRSVGGWEMD